jgi:transposase-like protein
MDAKTRKYYDPEFKRNAADLYLNGKVTALPTPSIPLIFSRRV